MFVEVFYSPFQPLLRCILFRRTPGLPVCPFQVASFVDIPYHTPVYPEVYPSHNDTLCIAVLARLTDFFPFFPFAQSQCRGKCSYSIQFHRASVCHQFGHFQGCLLQYSFDFSRFESTGIRYSAYQTVEVYLIYHRKPGVEYSFARLVYIGHFFHYILCHIFFLI